MQIYGFHGEYRFLSNFWPFEGTHQLGPLAPITIQGITYPTTEHAFVAAKTTAILLRIKIASISTPGAAKLFGRRLVLRSDWETIKDARMHYIVSKKFRVHADLRAELLATGNAELIEANTWNDRIWGVDRATGLGENRLGQILMRVRHELSAQFSSA